MKIIRKAFTAIMLCIGAYIVASTYAYAINSQEDVGRFLLAVGVLGALLVLTIGGLTGKKGEAE